MAYISAMSLITGIFQAQYIFFVILHCCSIPAIILGGVSTGNSFLGKKRISIILNISRIFLVLAASEILVIVIMPSRFRKSKN